MVSVIHTLSLPALVCKAFMIVLALVTFREEALLLGVESVVHTLAIVAQLSDALIIVLALVALSEETFVLGMMVGTLSMVAESCCAVVVLVTVIALLGKAFVFRGLCVIDTLTVLAKIRGAFVVVLAGITFVLFGFGSSSCDCDNCGEDDEHCLDRNHDENLILAYWKASGKQADDVRDDGRLMVRVECSPFYSRYGQDPTTG